MVIESTTSRNKAVDVVSALFLLEIIIDHVLTNSGCNNTKFSYVIRMFPTFMPWFFFKAGMMFKSPKGMSEQVRYRSKKLFYPFFVWSIIPCVIMLPLVVLNEGFVSYLKVIVSSLAFAHGPYNTPLWFLASLFFVYIFKEISHKYSMDSGGVILAALILTLVFNKLGLNIPLGLNYFPLGVFCFELGGFYHKKFGKLSKSILILLVLLYSILVLFYPALINFHKNETVYGSYMDGILIIVVFLLLLYGLVQREWNIWGLSYVGKKSMVLYVSHAPVLDVMRYLNDHYWYTSNSILFFTMLIGVAIVSTLLLLLYKKVSFLFEFK